MERDSWNEYFMKIAEQVATRATCPRKHVGAVIVRDKTILSTGYNGALRGLEHCSDQGCDLDEGNHCQRVVHAEANAIVQAAKNGVKTDGATIYVTASPCWPCFRLIANAGITEVFFREFYREQRIFSTAQTLGISLTHLSHTPQTP